MKLIRANSLYMPHLSSGILEARLTGKKERFSKEVTTLMNNSKTESRYSNVKHCKTWSAKVDNKHESPYFRWDLLSDGVKEIADTARSRSVRDKFWLAIENRDASKLFFPFLIFNCLVQFSAYGRAKIAKCSASPSNGYWIPLDVMLYITIVYEKLGICFGIFPSVLAERIKLHKLPKDLRSMDTTETWRRSSYLFSFCHVRGLVRSRLWQCTQFNIWSAVIVFDTRWWHRDSAFI